MFFSFPYKVGDKIQIHDKDFPLEGIIEDIRAFQLHLRLDNGDLVTYPNNLMLQKGVTLIEKDAIEHDFDDEGHTV
jgi:MscS family membrane protein